ncbi:sarcosine oxidase subunit gamma [Cohaesibacter gelatinilyticus]|uniref:Sarcosine oxidase subunit gamma n=1 Tax=Cohaesibacter gelatinilyticus TaxID=372072 RepID=A0A285NHB3_9HYPH|nr:sarcosine oxidase subunit gamma family protein [Cohaesibacter gelatinilyticus]SNZ08377.1 sarcosine oxidase subunit gamma [Cohaesibacter gelatinilyticus]
MTSSMEMTLNLPQAIGSQVISDMSGPVSIKLQEPKARLNLRIAQQKLSEASKAFGLEIPSKIHGYAEEGNRSALCLGPDEWILSASEDAKDDIVAAFADLYSSCPHSLTDISDRQMSISLSGEQAAELLSVGCPRDLGLLAVGSGTRTIFDGVEITLLRLEQDRFEMEVWRSFLPHMWALLHIGNQELASDQKRALLEKQQ